MIDTCDVIERLTGQQVTLDTPLEELEVDSLEFLDLLLSLSEVAGKSIEDHKIGSLKTVGDLERELA